MTHRQRYGARCRCHICRGRRAAATERQRVKAEGKRIAQLAQRSESGGGILAIASNRQRRADIRALRALEVGW